MFVTPMLTLFAGLSGEGVGPEFAADPHISPLLTAAQRAALTKSSSGEHGSMTPYLSRFNFKTAAENVRRLREAGVRILPGGVTLS